jgi:hypothetical protein
LQQLEAAELIEKGTKGVHKGRILSKKGMSLLDKTAASFKTPKLKPTVIKPKTQNKPMLTEEKAAPKKEVSPVVEKIKKEVVDDKREEEKKIKQKGVPNAHDLASKK